ncbi:hypothetical protein SLEP1_g33873 [Rubroshorea leprosula]|uniref:Patatin n=1 Tax=Rubroshorea leprosula TaxID=152421 RepID=A0AAV5KI01_9ROSI|nr:hypothetical protein SLEP1_g33873 [Rubroshorea leprosula]
MAPSSLSSLFLSHTFPSLTPNRHSLSRRSTLPPLPQTLAFSTKSTESDNLTTAPPPPPEETSSSSPSSERKSFSVATGELFLGITMRLLKTSNKGFSVSQNSGPIPVLEIPRQKSRNGRSGRSNGRYDEERIGVVMEDEIEPDVVIWEQRVKDIEAEKEKRVVTSPGFSFSAAGLLFPYHLGVAQYLIEKGYIKETTPLAGSSAGAIVCAVIASGATMQDALEVTKTLAEDCRLRGTAFRLGGVLRDVLQNFLPDDVHTRSNGRVRVAVTQILWKPRGLLVDQFDSKEDLINAVITSSFIPGYLAPRPATIYRNRLCIDGGLTLFMPPTSATKTVFA